ncbi:hypothetical protein [Tessaracoccus coleopterorum]|uniref:hypothetical protein n=1 Tax=Tessaracoccus coleopterorum TaxID=2714950 RepID=UPI001E5509D8|nr:hypothetical protein [Tessaracoccus coleopterorum]
MQTMPSSWQRSRSSTTSRRGSAWMRSVPSSPGSAPPMSLRWGRWHPGGCPRPQGGVYSLDGTKRVVLEIGLPTSELHAQRTGHNVANALLQRRADRFFAPEILDNIDFSKEHDDESIFIEGPEDDDRIRVLLPRQEGRLAQTLRENGLRVDPATLQEAKLLPADNIMAWGDWIVIPAAQSMWALRERGWDIPESKKVAAMGSTTRQVVEESGHGVDLSPKEPRAQPRWSTSSRWRRARSAS